MFALTLLLLTPVADPTPIVVVNRCPPVLTVVNKTPGVVRAKAATFRSGSYHADHDCPTCGREQLRVGGWIGNGQHYHSCRSCGTTWRH